MAKTSVKKSSSAQRRLIPIRRDQQWLQSRLQALPEKKEAEKDRELQKVLIRLNKKLSKTAFAACDKAAYADDQIQRVMHRYDIKQYMDYRAVNHGCAKQIFKAIHNGQDWKPYLKAHDRKVDRLWDKRNERLAREHKKKLAFLMKYANTDTAAYDQLKKQLEEQYLAEEKVISERVEKKYQAKEQQIRKKLEKCQHQMDKIKAAAASDITLPEDVLLRVEGLKMYFGGLKAVDDLTFDVKKGEIFGLIGPNGAGKTTVFNCITRFYDATDGQMYFENNQGEAVDLRAFQVHDVIVQGISRTFQNVELVREISVLDNLLTACTRDYRSNLAVQVLGLPQLRKEEEVLKEKAKKILKFMGLESYSAWYAMGLPYGVLKKVEIARALMADAKLIIMDEPAAGLNDSETAELTEMIRRIRDEFGVTILLVEHDMSLVMNVCDTVCAISFGKMLAIGTCDEIKANKAVQEAYLGVEEDGE